MATTLAESEAAAVKTFGSRWMRTSRDEAKTSLRNDAVPMEEPATRWETSHLKGSKTNAGIAPLY